MSDLPRFGGVDAAECDSFIQTIRKTALAKEKQDDDRWIAGYAAKYFVDEALRWYIGVEPVVTGSWLALQRAMIRRWPRDTEHGKQKEVEPALSEENLAPYEKFQILVKRLNPPPGAIPSATACVSRSQTVGELKEMVALLSGLPQDKFELTMGERILDHSLTGATLEAIGAKPMAEFFVKAKHSDDSDSDSE